MNTNTEISFPSMKRQQNKELQEQQDLQLSKQRKTQQTLHGQRHQRRKVSRFHIPLLESNETYFVERRIRIHQEIREYQAMAIFFGLSVN